MARFARIVGVTVTFTATTWAVLRRHPKRFRPVLQSARQTEGARRLCRALNLYVEVEGELDPRRPSLIVSNHFGVLDPLVLASALPLAFVGKAELARWPVVGWVTQTMGVLFAHRGSGSRARHLIALIRQRLDDGVNVLVFPEGTTSPGPELRRFKTGSFAAVAGTAYPVVPVFLQVVEVEGKLASHQRRKRVVWADSETPFLRHFLDLMSLRSVRMKVWIGKPIDASSLDRKQVAAGVRQKVDELRLRAATETSGF